MNSPKVLVTGGAGYIGSHTCKALAAEGLEPVVFDNLVNGHRDAVCWGPFIHGDILDSSALSRALKMHRPVAIIHFAAFAYVGESVKDPEKYYRNNVAGALSLLEACREADLNNIIVSSSCAVYGTPERLPITEATPLQPISPYGRSKLFIEQALADYAAAYGLRYVALRYFNAAGADPDGKIFERHDPETHLVPLALMAAFGRIPELALFGDDYETPDGTCVRDYIHVSDLARAHVLALRYLIDGGANLAFNLGSGHGTSVREVLTSVERVTGRHVPYVIEPRRPGDPPALYSDAALARQHLGFAPELSDIETIARTAAPFFELGA